MGLMRELKAAGITTLAQLKAALGGSSGTGDKDFGTTGQVRPPPGLSVVLVKVTSAASGGGKYNGVFVRAGTASIPASGDLAETEFGTVPTTDSCVILNGAEVGKSTHDLTNGTPVGKIFVGVLLPMRSTTGIYAVAINGIDWENCT